MDAETFKSQDQIAFKRSDQHCIACEVKASFERIVELRRSSRQVLQIENTTFNRGAFDNAKNHKR